MNFEYLKKTDPEIFSAVCRELGRQQQNIELIASENFTSCAVMEAQGTVLTNKYAEGYPKARWYGGCIHVDEAEALAQERVKALFGAEYANVQPHSGTQANMAVMFSVLNPGDTVLAMDLACGGHLSHGHPLNFSGKFYRVIPYGVDKKTEFIDYAQIEELAKAHKPKLIIAGASAYPRVIDFQKFRSIADSVQAMLLVDMAHFAGLVASGLHPNPCEYAEFVTSTTHKTLRGPRGGFILARKEFAKQLNTGLFPGIQGGPLMHVIAAKAVAFLEAQTPEFKRYQQAVVENVKVFCHEFTKLGMRVVSGGSDNHLLLLDLRSLGKTGKEAVASLDEIHITVNKNLIPYDPQPPIVTSGIRIGSPAITTRGMRKAEIAEIAQIIFSSLADKQDKQALQGRVKALTDRFPLYAELQGCE